MSARGVSSPTVVGLMLMLVLWLVAGCASPGQEKEKGSQASGGPVVGEFVGEIPEADTFVALVAEEPQEGGDTREVRAYLCDDESINEWFVGSASGDELQLTSESGVQLLARLTGESSTGTVTLTDGRSFPFEALPATGIPGLYDVSTTSGGQVSGTSWSGARLEGQRADSPQEDGNYLISGTIIPTEGQLGEFKAEVAGTEATEGRFIVLPDGRLKGGKKGPGFIDQESEL